MKKAILLGWMGLALLLVTSSALAAADPKALVEALRRSRDVDEQKSLVSKIEDLGAADGDSPASVKRYLVEEATPLLVKIAKTGKNSFLRGDAIHALRSLRPPRAVLEEVADMAERDSDSYVQSRGEILRNYIKSLPADAAVETIKPKDEAREQKGIAYLKKKNVGVSSEQLFRSSLQGNFNEVRALIDAGVDVNAGTWSESPLYGAVFSGCGAAGGENEALIKTVDALLGAGADVKRKDDNGNNIVMSAAQMCGGKIVAKLIAAGADPNIVNGSGVSPLAMALIMKKLDAAEVLVDEGARLDAKQAMMVSGSATDARSKAIIAKATAK